MLKRVVVIGIGALVIIGGVVGFLIWRNTTVSTKEHPDYATILPTGKSIDQLGGWKRVSPPEADPVYTFTDSIDGVSINVSEQPLPSALEGDIAAQVADLATKFNATNQIDAGDVKAYIGTSAKGPQSVIFTKKRLLILIKSQEKISSESWSRYIKALN